MDIVGLSSPPAPRSSLSPSNAPLPSANSKGSPSSNPRSSPTAARRQPVDALAFGDDEAEEDEDGNESTARRRRRARGQANADVPLVKDAVGESVAESFETFLKRCDAMKSRVIVI